MMIVIVIGLIAWAIGYVRRHTHQPTPVPIVSVGTVNGARRSLNDYPLSRHDREYVENWEKRSPMYTKMYWGLVGGIFVVSLVAGLGLIGYIFSIDFSNPMSKDTLTNTVFLVVYVVLYLSILTPLLRGCVKTVEQDEVAMLYVLGFPVKVCDPGPVIVLFDGRFMSPKRASTQTNQKQYPADTNDITYVAGGLEPEGKKQLLRVTLLGPNSSNPGDDPWKQPRTIGIGFTLSLMPDTDHPIIYFRFTGSIEQAQGWASDIVLSKYVALLANETPDSLLRNMDILNNKLKEEVEKVLNPRGVVVVRAELVLPDLGQKFNEAIQLKADATLERVGRLIKAETKKQEDVLDGQAQQLIKKLLFEAEAFGYEKIATALGMTSGKEIILMVESMKNVLEKSNNTTLLGMNGVTELLAGARTLLTGMNGGSN